MSDANRFKVHFKGTRQITIRSIKVTIIILCFIFTECIPFGFHNLIIRGTRGVVDSEEMRWLTRIFRRSEAYERVISRRYTRPISSPLFAPLPHTPFNKRQ